MSRRLFRLMLVHQKIDDALRFEQRRRVPDPYALQKLGTLKLRAKTLMSRLVRSPKATG